jgi:hypothetical protein
MGAEQLGGEPLGGAADLGAVQMQRAAGGLDRDRLVAVAVARLGVWVALVALPTKERGHLSLQRRLQQQAGAKARDVLHDAGQVTGGVGEQLVDLGADALDRRYSCGHGRGSPF